MKSLNSISTLDFVGVESEPWAEYTAEDGLAHCCKCHGARQVRVTFRGEERVVRCICACQEQAEDEKDTVRHREAMMLKNRAGMPANIELPGWRGDFSQVDQSTAPYDKLATYAERFAKMKAARVGLLLFGPPSCGKTFGACFLADAVEKGGSKVLVTAPTRILNELQDLRAKNRNNLIDSICRFDLIVLDDLGSERATDFTREQIFVLIDSIYRSGAALVVTTNLSLKQMKAPEDMGTQRIYERLLECCRPMAFPEKNWRDAAAAAAQQQARTLFDL